MVGPFELKAKELRKDILKMIYAAKSGHLAGSLSALEILMILYLGSVLNLPNPPNLPNLPKDFDRFILSNGHICPALYAVLAEAGFFPKDELQNFRELGSFLQGHASIAVPGVEYSSGSLAQGLSVACGMALTAKMDKKQGKTYCLMSDAEQQEGQIWEAVEFAAKYKLDNLVAIIDQNGIQIDGFVKEVMPLGDLKARYQSFDWEVIEVADGHDFNQLKSAFEDVKVKNGQPKVIIAKTIAAKGIGFMENDFQWHSVELTDEIYQKALKEIDNG